MSNAFRLPTLSSSGVLENPSLILDRLIKYFLASNQNQSNIFQSEVASLKYIVHLYSKNPSGFKDALINSLDKLLKRYFKSVEILVQLNDTTTESLVKEIQLEINVVDRDNIKGSFSKNLNLEDYEK